MCRECLYDPQAKGTWREQTDGCTAEGCPLYNFRPRATVRLKAA
jgi:hypothetical protein